MRAEVSVLSQQLQEQTQLPSHQGSAPTPFPAPKSQCCLPAPFITTSPARYQLGFILLRAEHHFPPASSLKGPPIPAMVHMCWSEAPIAGGGGDISPCASLQTFWGSREGQGVNSQGRSVVPTAPPVAGNCRLFPSPPAQGGRCLLVHTLNSAAGLGLGSNPGKGGEGKGMSPETCWWQFVPVPRAKVGLCRWKWQWGLWETHAGTSREGQRPAGPCGGLKGPKMSAGAPGQCQCLPGQEELLQQRQDHATLRFPLPTADAVSSWGHGCSGVTLGSSSLPGHKRFSRVLGFPGQSRPQPCACLVGGMQPGEPG